MSRGESDGDPPADLRRLESNLRHSALRSAFGFASLFRLFSRNDENGDSRTAPVARLHGFILSMTLAFIVAALVASASLVVYTAWTHDLENGLFALAFAVAASRVAMNWLVWKNEET